MGDWCATLNDVSEEFLTILPDAYLTMSYKIPEYNVYTVESQLHSKYEFKNLE